MSRFCDEVWLKRIPAIFCSDASKQVVTEREEFNSLLYFAKQVIFKTTVDKSEFTNSALPVFCMAQRNLTVVTVIRNEFHFVSSNRKPIQLVQLQVTVHVFNSIQRQDKFCSN